MVLLIPTSYPIFKREMGSHMYSATAYFVAATMANVLVNIFYPIIVSLLSFWWYQYPVSDLYGFLCFLLVMMTAAMCGVAFGQVIGSFARTEMTALIVLMQTLTTYYMGAGVLSNASASGSNWFGTFLQWISPLRYLNELALRRMLAGRLDIIQNGILEKFGFEYGVFWCSFALASYIVVCLLIGCFLMHTLSKGS